MTREKFISMVPASIIHKKYGEGKLKTLSYMDKTHMAWYRHDQSKVSGTSFGNDWNEVYENLKKFLVEEGHIYASE